MVYHKYSPFRWYKLKQRLKAEGSEVVTIVTDWIEKLNLQGFLVTSLSTQSSAQPSARENFFSKKYTHAGSPVNTTLPAGVYTISLSKISNRLISPNGLERLIACDFSAQNYQKCRRYGITIIYRGIHV